MTQIEEILERLIDFYDLDNLTQLADKINVSQPTLSKWKARDSILPAKRICKELGIYDEIFSNLNSTKNDFRYSRNNNGQFFSDSDSAQIYNIDEKSNIDEKFLKLVELIYISAKDNNRLNELNTDMRKLFDTYYS